MAECIFCRIMAGELPSDRVYEDDQVVAFRDINPKAPVHVLVIPRRHLASVDELEEADSELAGRLLLVARDLARGLGLQRGFRVVINTGPDGGQTVSHLHLHLLGGRGMHWPPG